jgi:hypothetical protein
MTMSDNPYSSPATSPVRGTSQPGATGEVRIASFGVLQTAKVLAVLYFLITAIFCIPFGLFMMVAGGASNNAAAGIGGGIGLLFFPVIYAIGGFIGGIIACFFYNLVAGWVGGISVNLDRG